MGVWLVLVLALCAAGLPVPVAAQTSPDAHRLLVTSYVEYAQPPSTDDPTHAAVVSMAADGSDARQVSPPDVDAQLPVGSPDGRWIAYTRYEGPNSSVVVIPASGGEERLVADEAGAPMWSPDGSLLAYVSGIGAERDLALVSVTEEAGEITFGAPRTIPVGVPVFRPSFSPTGDALVFQTAQYNDWDRAEVWTVRTDGSDRRLVSGGVTPWWGIRSQSWSPDGDWIAFLATDSSEPGMPRVHLVRPDGTGLRRLSTQTCNYDDTFAWEPYGRYLAVVPACSIGIHLVAPDGELITTVAAEDAQRGRLGYELQFSPDATALYALLHEGNDTARVLQIPVDGSPVRALDPAYPVNGHWLELLGPLQRPSTPPPMPEPPPPPSEPPPDEWQSHPDWDRRSDLAEACPRQRVPDAPFRDVADSTRTGLVVDCAVWWRLMAGQSPRRFAPAAGLTRGQLATVLAGVLDRVGALHPTSTDYFDDDDASVHEPNINRLREAGVVQGIGRRFEPDRRVRREHMASFVVAVFERVTDRVLPESAGDRFDDDDGSVHEANINRAFDADLVSAIARRRFDPAAAQRRDDAADSALRIYDALIAIGRLFQPTYGEAFVTRVVDGDTFIADVHQDNGQVSKGVRIRMAGINAPERATCSGSAAKATLRRGMERRRVRVSSKHATSVGRDDRPIRFVHVYVHDWLDISWEMLRLGHALWMPHRVEPARQRSFNRVVQRAAANQVGMWNPMACGFGPQQNARLQVRVRPDAPGRDRDNLNGEVVRIRNVGSTAVRLDGWWLRESSQHPPYRFAAGTRVPAGKTLTVHVGAGIDRPLRKYWNARRALFDNPNATGSRGDGAYLYDPDGDIRSHHIYPCLVSC